MRLAEAILLAVLALATVGLWLAPAPDPIIEKAPHRTERALVLSVDDSGLQTHGQIRFGTQRLTVRLKDGREIPAYNELRAQLELDKVFEPGDTALVIVRETPDGELVADARDHGRLGWAAALFGVFALALLAFGGTTGLRALFTFVFSCLVIWKLMIPLALAGHGASGVAFLTVLVLTLAIVFCVAGLTRKGTAAALGALLGVLASLVLAHLASRLLKISGATMPYAQQLLYSGAPNVDLQDIFIGAAVLASSGAVMDLAMDIASGIDEVARHAPGLGFRALCASGLRIGRAVVGTMTTTLLLAYSGGYLTLLLVFAAEGTSPADFLNTTLVSAEVVKTLVGSLGLVLVAPFTALVGALVFTHPTTRV